MHLVAIPATQQIDHHDSHFLNISILLHISEQLSVVDSRKLELHPQPLSQVKGTPITERKMSVTSTTLPSCTSLL